MTAWTRHIPRLLTGRRRKATVRALAQCRLLQFSRAVLNLTSEDAQREYVREQLPMIPVFAGLGRSAFERLLGVFRYKDFAEGCAACPPPPLISGPWLCIACALIIVVAVSMNELCMLGTPSEYIIREGELPTAFHVLCSGEVDVTKPSEGFRRLATLTAHTRASHDCYPFFGEMGFLYGDACTVRAPGAPGPACATS